MLSVAGRCELSTTHVKPPGEIQGIATFSFIPPRLLQKSWLCVQPMFPERNASCKQDLVLDKARSIAFTAQ